MQQRSAPSNTARRSILRDNGLSIVLAAGFVIVLLGQVLAGLAAYNEELEEHGRAATTLGVYLTSGHFLEATFENWESEFLQMAVFVLLTARLFQRGSSESKDPDQDNDCDEDPREHRADPGVPWPVRRGGWVLKLYEHSLSIAFLVLFVTSVALHAVGGLRLVNEERALQGQPLETFADYAKSAQFWYESFQNWQSEFLAMLCVVTFSIFLRERGSAQSKPVAASHSETEG